MKHIDDDVLKRYYDGSLSSREMDDCEKHLAQCDTCRSGFAVFVRLMDANVSANEASILDKAKADLPSRAPVSLSPTLEKPPQSRWPVWKLTVIAASFVLAAGAIWVLLFFNVR